MRIRSAVRRCPISLSRFCAGAVPATSVW
jgi:hypothetical protein